MFPRTALNRLEDIHALHRWQKENFFERSVARRSELFASVKEARNELLDDLFTRVREARRESAVLAELRVSIYSYFDQCDWAFLDAVALAATTTVPAQQIASALAPNAVIYHALRMLDDVLDGHMDYKGGQPTLYGVLRSDSATVDVATAGNLIPAMLAMASLSAALTEQSRWLIQETLIGALHEGFPGDWSTLESYRQIATAKMVAYGQFLYRPVMLTFPSPAQEVLEPFLARSFYISQVINDLQDSREDQLRKQPNYWLLDREPAVAVRELISEIEALASTCDTIPPPASDYAHARVTDVVAYLLQVIQSG